MADGFYDRLAPSLLAALALLGAYHRQTSLVALATTLLFTLLLTRAWSRRSLHAVSYERRVSDDRAFPGDELRLTLRLGNHKLLPLPWMEVDDAVPSQLEPVPAKGESTAGIEKDRLRLSASVAWNERISWHYRLRCHRRGIYQLGPAAVTSGDPFGLFPRSSTLGAAQQLVVYPRLVPLERLGLPAGFPLGERKPDRWIFEDPSRTVGVRDYRPEDSFRRIHWKATARRQQLQVKLQEPSTTLETALFLGVDTFSSLPDTRFEHGVSVVASLAHELIGQRHPVGLYVNGGVPGSKGNVELAPGSSQEQLIRILELLAGIQPEASGPVDLLLAEAAPRLPWGACVVVVVGKLSEGLAAALQQLKLAGRSPAVLVVEGDQQLSIADL
ncbi:MAG: DUF58 domain-containing protein [Chloroflexota bacterium]